MSLTQRQLPHGCHGFRGGGVVPRRAAVAAGCGGRGGSTGGWPPVLDPAVLADRVRQKKLAPGRRTRAAGRAAGALAGHCRHPGRLQPATASARLTHAAVGASAPLQRAPHPRSRPPGCRPGTPGPRPPASARSWRARAGSGAGAGGRRGGGRSGATGAGSCHATETVPLEQGSKAAAQRSTARAGARTQGLPCLTCGAAVARTSPISAALAAVTSRRVASSPSACSIACGTGRGGEGLR